MNDVHMRPVRVRHGYSNPERPEPPGFLGPIFATRIDRDLRRIWVREELDGALSDEMGPFDADAFEVRRPDEAA